MWTNILDIVIAVDSIIRHQHIEFYKRRSDTGIRICNLKARVENVLGNYNDVTRNTAKEALFVVLARHSQYYQE